jgi:predicted metalloprotease with PDZ domain
VCTRELDGQAVEFGTSGYTKDHVFVLYDRTSDSVWWPMSDETLDAVAGPRRGASIPFIDEPAPVALGAWLDEHPRTQILLPSPEDAERLAERGRRPFLGVGLDDRDEGLVITGVRDGTPADEAQLRAGDVIRVLDGRAVTDRASLREIMGDLEPGDEVVLVVERDGREQAFDVTLGRR